MKKLIVTVITFIAVFALVSSCRKNDNPNLGPLTRVPLPLLTDSASDEIIPSTGSFTRSFTVDLYFKSDVQPKSIDIVVVKDGVKTNYSDTSMKILQAGITTFPTIVTFADTTLVRLFGPLGLGDIYEFGANITLQNGEEVPAFITGTSTIKGGSAYGPDIAKLPGANVELTYKTPCQFDATIFSGSYTFVEDDWADFAPGDAVPSVTAGPAANQITIVAYPNPAYGTNRQPMIVTIDTLNPGAGNASVANQVIGDYGGAPPNNTVQTDGGAAAGNSFVDFCTGEVHLSLDFNLGSAGDYPGNIMDITK
ncbi:MAG TPA: hypothetical protein VK718_09475 [Ferruginibacter sp.]|jgi:hypothetical protein|nr:hypothetical protein [Ferruginibacter sp.]